MIDYLKLLVDETEEMSRIHRGRVVDVVVHL